MKISLMIALAFMVCSTVHLITKSAFIEGRMCQVSIIAYDFNKTAQNRQDMRQFCPEELWSK